MSWSKFIAAQLRQPSGFFGRYVMTRLLNRINIPMNELAFETLQLDSCDKVLEIGFGGGDLIMKMSRVLHRGRITGVDVSQDAVLACAKRFAPLIGTGILDLHCANVNELPFEAGIFTKACTVNTIYFWPAPLGAFLQIHRVLKEHGRLVVCFSPRTVMENHGRVIHHGFTLYEPEEVTSLLTEAGFGDVQLIFRTDRFGECIVATGKK